MKKLTQFAQRGFTLVELLIVIAILGIMSAALIATIDPIEQVRKAQDTDLREKSVEFLNANTRYYTTHNALPWFTVANGGANCYTGGNTLTTITLNNLTTCITALVSDGELKQGFSNASNLSQIAVTNPNPQTGSSSDTTVCFMPQSKSQQKDANTRYNQNGSNGTSCKSSGGTNNCYWCAQ
jgi:prepilin-type N-terminal cleavage/methylation domain-containing protein